jgi:hypothetical protein
MLLQVQVQERNRRKIPHDCLSANFWNITYVDLAKTDLNGLVFSNTSDISGVICCCFFMLSISFLCISGVICCCFFMLSISFLCLAW